MSGAFWKASCPADDPLLNHRSYLSFSVASSRPFSTWDIRASGRVAFRFARAWERFNNANQKIYLAPINFCHESITSYTDPLQSKYGIYESTHQWCWAPVARILTSTTFMNATFKGHRRNITEAFGPPDSPHELSRSSQQPLFPPIPDPPVKAYLVVIKGPKPGLFYDFRWVSNMIPSTLLCSTRNSYRVLCHTKLLDNLHSIYYVATDENDAYQTFRQAQKAGMLQVSWAGRWLWSNMDDTWEWGRLHASDDTEVLICFCGLFNWSRVFGMAGVVIAGTRYAFSAMMGDILGVLSTQCQLFHQPHQQPAHQHVKSRITGIFQPRRREADRHDKVLKLIEISLGLGLIGSPSGGDRFRHE